MLRAIEHVFRQEMNKSALFWARFLNRIYCADKTVLEDWVLLLHKPRQLRIGGRTAQRNDERFDDRNGDGSQQTQSEPNDGPRRNTRGIRQSQADQKRNDRDTQDP